MPALPLKLLLKRKLEKRALKKDSIGREKIYRKSMGMEKSVWRYNYQPVKKLGCSCDWSRNSFGQWMKIFQLSVRKVFVDLHQKGLIFKSKKLVNWDTSFKDGYIRFRS